MFFSRNFSINGGKHSRHRDIKQSMKTKCIRERLLKTKVEIVCMTETINQKSISDSEIALQLYNVFRANRKY